jgi:single-stranded DNA-binding protein
VGPWDGGRDLSQVVDARIRANSWTDQKGEKHYDHSFVVQGFRFGPVRLDGSY